MHLDTSPINQTKLVFTGGHHTPALAVIEKLSDQFDIYWFGHKYSMHGYDQISAEYKTITGLGITFYNLHAGKIFRTWNLIEWLRVPFGFLQSLWWLLKIRPQLIVSFGGYLAVPVVVAGKVLGIPSVTHEQTVVSGWANRVIALFADRIFVTWEQSKDYFPAGKVSVVGLPLRKDVLGGARKDSVDDITTLLTDLPTIYVTGGKQGSQIINRAVIAVLPDLLEQFNVIHQCGSVDYETLEKETEAISGTGSYVLKPYFDESQIGSIFDTADFVVSRSGANIVYELAALGKPAIFIPIPWVSHDEQRKNAKILEDVGSAIVIDQDDFTPDLLLSVCNYMLEKITEYKQQAGAARSLVKLDAVEKMAQEIECLSISS